MEAKLDVSMALNRRCGKDPESMNLQTGDSVYVWKKSGGREGRPRYYHWAGPGVVIGREGRSAIWVSLNGFITKAPPEAVRPTSEEENIAITEVDDVLKRTTTISFQSGSIF